MSVRLLPPLPADDNPSSPQGEQAQRVPTLSRAQFLALFAQRYQPGQHVTFIGPTQRGKTTLCIQCLKVVISPTHRVVILAGKPPGRDPGLLIKAPKELNLRVVKEWPPEWMPNDRKRNGYVLAPKQEMKDDSDDDKEIAKQFKRAIMANFRASKNPVITVADEAYQVQNDLGLKKVYEKPLLRGAPHNAMWSLLQRGAYVSYLSYSAPEHIFIAFDPDTTNQTRYGEIGGVNPKQVTAIVSKLKRGQAETGGIISEFLYISRSRSEMYIISMD